MNPPTHVLINAAFRKLAAPQIPARPFIIGGFVPDVPLTLLTAGMFVYTRFVLNGSDAQVRATMTQIFDDRYFNDPVWIAAHNVLHSPTLLLIELALLWGFRERLGSPLRTMFYFLLGCLFHGIGDVLTHYNDGPVLFFPFDWHTRFYSPVSYWDPAHYGGQFAIFELALNLALLAYLIIPWLRRRRAANARNPTSGEEG